MEEFLSKEYWEQLYINGETAWDMNEVSPPLKVYFDQLKNKNVRILIPGCGNSYEAEYLAKNGFTEITIIDIAKEPVERLQIILNDYPTVTIIQEDFFNHDGNYDLIIEQTFFCALQPQLREKYAEKMFDLLDDNGGTLAGVMFKTEFQQPGPPFGGTPAEYIRLFEKWFRIKTLADCYNSHEKRMGNEVFIQFIKEDPEQ
jgi:hypothetical protein